MDGLALAMLLATFNKAFLDLLAQPIQKRFPSADLWWMIYVACVTGGLMAWFAGVNIFGALISAELIGRVLTCVAVGAGTNLINQVFTALPTSGGRAGGFRGDADGGGKYIYRGW